MQQRRARQRPRHVRRIPILFATLIVALGSLAGCGAGASPVPSPSPQASPVPTVAEGGPAGSAGLPSATPVTTDRAQDGAFELSIAVDKGAYAPDEPITASARLTYIGPKATVTAFGSGSGLVIMDLQQLDGPLDPGGLATSDCRPYDLTRGVPLDIPYRKAGGWDAEDPNAAWYVGFFDDPQLRLPAGVWRLTAGLEAATGDGCGDPWHRLQASVTFVVGG
jgi:hypothetical protein